MGESHGNVKRSLPWCHLHWQLILQHCDGQNVYRSPLSIDCSPSIYHNRPSKYSVWQGWLEKVESLAPISPSQRRQYISSCQHCNDVHGWRQMWLHSWLRPWLLTHFLWPGNVRLVKWHQAVPKSVKGQTSQPLRAWLWSLCRNESRAGFRPWHLREGTHVNLHSHAQIALTNQKFRPILLLSNWFSLILK